MPGGEYEKALELATDQHGFLTTAQAQQLGITRDTIRKMAKRGTLDRVRWGVYRLPTFPVSTFAEYMEASLWPAGVQGVISHESALVMRDLSDVNPPKVHITVPRTFRVRRAIEDCYRTHLGPALLRQAVEDGQREGYLKPDEARELRKLVLP